MNDNFEMSLTEVLSMGYGEYIRDVNARAEETEHVFSENFERKMEKLIKRHKNPWYMIVSTPAKKIAAVIILAIILSFSTAMTIRASREAIIKFFVEMYETFSVVFFGEVDPDTGEPRFASEDNDNSGVITDIYEITYVPEGYELVYEEEHSKRVTKIFDKEGAIAIKFLYVPIEEFAKIVVDTENTEVQNFFVNNTKYQCVILERYVQVVWQEKGYAFVLTSNNIEEAKRIINSIILKEK